MSGATYIIVRMRQRRADYNTDDMIRFQMADDLFESRVASRAHYKFSRRSTFHLPPPLLVTIDGRCKNTAGFSFVSPAPPAASRKAA